jgi:hypothetical protein
MKRTNADSLAPPALSGCVRGCGNDAVTVEFEATDEGGGDSNVSVRKPPPVDLDGEEVMMHMQKARGIRKPSRCGCDFSLFVSEI